MPGARFYAVPLSLSVLLIRKLGTSNQLQIKSETPHAISLESDSFGVPGDMHLIGIDAKT